MAEKALHQVEVHLYIKGQGPKHRFTADLKGWEPNRLDLANIRSTYNLRAVYAFSAISGRGMELVPNHRNGLSHTVYTGKPGTVIRLDGEPKPPTYSFLNSSMVTIGSVVFVVALSAGIISMDDQRVEHFEQIKREGPGWPIILSGSLILAIYGWRLWRRSLSRAFDRRLA